MKTHRTLFYEYVMLYRPYINKLNEWLAPFHLYASQWSILSHLWQQGGQTVSEISLHKKVEKPTTTKMVQRLLELELVEVTSGRDKRTKTIQISDYGLDICQQIEEKISEYQAYLLEDFSEEEQELVIRVLQNVSEKIGKGKG
ncbi:MarR family winged helix-turn-helix transcriptional regulator [Halobacillus massiliensis]|uniref:MarR family winged helix-turn-helix transcriptional regulator n=1 Tax=Halobacillus massiliensis TaxID=1926286 RepID=UPI0009E57869|nr:MarR family transcriptional regulator [Halobacillus massiliensis]